MAQRKLYDKKKLKNYEMLSGLVKKKLEIAIKKNNERLEKASD